jgi:hypothetical protein
MLVMGVASPYFLTRMDASAAALLEQAGRREIRVETPASSASPTEAARR